MAWSEYRPRSLSIGGPWAFIKFEWQSETNRKGKYKIKQNNASFHYLQSGITKLIMHSCNLS